MLATLLQSLHDAHTAGRWDEALGYAEAALKAVAVEGDAGDAADVFRRIGVIHRDRGDLELAMEATDASLCVANLNGLQVGIAKAKLVLATIHQLRGSLELAEQVYKEAGELAVELGEEQLAALVEQNLGVLANIRGDITVALRSYGSALDRYQRIGDHHPAAGVLNNMALAHLDLEEWKAAECCFDEAQKLAALTRDVFLVGRVDLNRAELFLKRQQFELARESCDRALSLFGELKAKSPIGEAYKFYGMVFRETSKFEQAGLHLALSVGLAESCEDLLLQAEAQTEWALVHVEEGKVSEAIRRLNRAYKIFGQLQAKRELMDIDRRLGKLKQTYLPTVQSWGVQQVEARDPFRTGRTERVVQYSAALGQAVGVSGWGMTWLRTGATVHDVGHSAMPIEVLGKVGALSAGERELMQSHTVLGDAMVSELDFPGEIRSMVRNHHERWDGKGYPDKMVGEEIPLNARILSVVDVFDALTSDRSWRPAYSKPDALVIMGQESGKLLDPNLFGTFRELVTAGAAEEKPAWM